MELRQMTNYILINNSIDEGQFNDKTFSDQLNSSKGFGLYRVRKFAARDSIHILCSR